VFIDRHAAPAVVHLAATFLAVAAVFQLVDSTQAVGAGSLRGLWTRACRCLSPAPATGWSASR